MQKVYSLYKSICFCKKAVGQKDPFVRVVKAKAFTRVECKNQSFAGNAPKNAPKGYALTLCAIPKVHSEGTYAKQIAFSQAGKCLVQTLLFDHPKISLLRLTESTNNVVSSLQGLPSIETRANLETLLIGFYAGKAGELFNGIQRIWPHQPFSLSLLKSKYKAYTPQQRKDLIRVNGLFANGMVFRAKTNYQTRTNFPKIRYTCDIPCVVWTKQGLRSKSNTFDFLGENTDKTKNKANVKEIQNKKRGGQVERRCVDATKAQPQNKIVRSCVQIKNVLPLIDVLSREQYDSRSACLGHFALAKQLNRSKIEQFLSQSDTGLLERIRATFIAQSIAVNGSIYSPNILSLQKNSIVGNLNKTEIADKKVFNLFQSLEEQIRNVYLQKDILNRSFGSKNSFLTNSYKKEFITKQKLVTEPSGSQAFQSTQSFSSQNEIFATPTNTLLFSKKTSIISQKNDISALCEEIVCKSLTFSIKPYGHWFRIYLPQIETHQRQMQNFVLHSVSADQFFKKRRELGFLKSTNENLFEIDFQTKIRVLAKHCQKFALPLAMRIPLISYESSNISFLKISQNLEAKTQTALPSTRNVLTQRSAHGWPQELGYGLCHHLVLNTFSQAFDLLSQNRELLDVLADHLIRFEKIRMPEISRICSFYVNKSDVSFTRVDKNSIVTVTRPLACKSVAKRS